MITFKSISMKNFLSFGNVPQVVQLDKHALSIIIGVNNDGTTNDGSEETRNGVGKSSVVQGLNFALFGKAIDNKIKLSNLINKTNKKDCVVELVFQKDDVEYKIIRSRSPNNLEFYKGTDLLSSDEAQGENKDTQEEIISIIGMTQELFTQIVTLTTSAESFLSQSAAKQKLIIEELFTITTLSEKSDKLKELLRGTKEQVEREKFKIDTFEASNAKINENILTLKDESSKWILDNDLKISTIKNELKKLTEIDILTEIQLHKENNINNNKNLDYFAKKQTLDKLIQAAELWNTNSLKSINDAKQALDKLNSIDINSELQKHSELQLWNQLKTIFDSNALQIKAHNNMLNTYNIQYKKQQQIVSRLKNDVDICLESTCPTCSQKLAGESHLHVVTTTKEQYTLAETHLNEIQTSIDLVTENIKNIDIFDMPEKPVTVYNTFNDAKNHESLVLKYNEFIKSQSNTVNPYNTQLDDARDDFSELNLHQVHQTVYRTIDEAFEHATRIEKLLQDLDFFENQENPIIPQIQFLRDNSLSKIDYTELNRLRKMQEHQEFLIKLLSDKNSFVRKKIIDQNLVFLNKRMTHYTTETGLIHSVRFINDLSTEILKFGEDYDFDNLSRGEKNRVILALAMSFRDMFETLNSSINILIVDELLDFGLDVSGAKTCYKILYDFSTKNKNTFLITHKEDLQSKCENICTVTMENGFSTLVQD